MFIISLSIQAHAEYRVFELRIVHVDTEKERTTLSTLDQYQYPTYYPVSLRERIDLVDHWLCPERTDGMELCPKPMPRSPEKEQNSIDQDLIPQG